MIDDRFVLTIERLRDDLTEFLKQLRAKYKSKDRQVVSAEIKEKAAGLAETWLVHVTRREEVSKEVASDYLADVTVHFQRLLTLSEKAVKRLRYENEVKAILKDFNLNMIIPLKQARARTNTSGQESRQLESAAKPPAGFEPTAFLGHSFAAADEELSRWLIELLEALGLKVVTGAKPRADKISEKVKSLIENQHFFVGFFTRKDRVVRRQEWTTSAWVIDEKAYALGKGKRLVLIKEDGVQSIGGIQGDYEFLEFSREKLYELAPKLASLFEVELVGFAG